MTSPAADIRFYGIDKLQVKLQQLERRAGENLARRAVRAAAKPMLAEIKRRTPERTGALRKSLTVQVAGSSKSTGAVYAYIWPAKNFTMARKTPISGERYKLRWKKGETLTVRDADGRRIHRQNHPLQYVSPVEAGGRYNKAVWMIRDGAKSTSLTALGILRNILREALDQ